MKAIRDSMVTNRINPNEVNVVPAVGFMLDIKLDETHTTYIMSEEYIRPGMAFDDIVKVPSMFLRNKHSIEYTELDRKYAQQVLATVYLAYIFNGYQAIEDYNPGNLVVTADGFALIDIGSKPKFLSDDVPGEMTSLEVLSKNLKILVGRLWDPYVRIILGKEGEINLDIFKDRIKSVLAKSNIENETEYLSRMFEEAVKKVATSKRATTSSPLIVGAVVGGKGEVASVIPTVIEDGLVSNGTSSNLRAHSALISEVAGLEKLSSSALYVHKRGFRPKESLFAINYHGPPDASSALNQEPRYNFHTFKQTVFGAGAIFLPVLSALWLAC